jgi:D-alanine-D-alanine ligase
MASAAELRVVVLHDTVDPAAGPDVQDTLVQASAVRDALARLGCEVDTLAVHADARSAGGRITALRPKLVFNLVESTVGFAHTVDGVPRLLDELGIPYTGCPAAALRQTSDKLAAKRHMTRHGLPTPAVWRGESDGRWIGKSVWEHASLGMDDGCVVAGHEVEALLRERRRCWGGDWFAEAYVEGREINVSLLEIDEAPRVLAVAEIDFIDYAADKPRIVGYSAKWLQDSFEYVNTPRCFLDDDSHPTLRHGVIELALQCWARFGLRGYARVDLRVDRRDRPWLLDVNANPCLSPDAGFAAALEHAGIAYDAAVAHIVTRARCGRRDSKRPAALSAARR